MTQPPCSSSVLAVITKQNTYFALPRGHPPLHTQVTRHCYIREGDTLLAGGNNLLDALPHKSMVSSIHSFERFHTFLNICAMQWDLLWTCEFRNADDVSVACSFGAFNFCKFDSNAGLSLTLVYSSTNMSKSVWTSGFWKPLVHKNMSNFWNFILKILINNFFKSQKRSFLVVKIS